MLWSLDLPANGWVLFRETQMTMKQAWNQYEPIKTHEIQLDSCYRANLGTLTMLCKLASCGLDFFHGRFDGDGACGVPLLIYWSLEFDQRTSPSGELIAGRYCSRLYHDATPILGGTLW